MLPGPHCPSLVRELFVRGTEPAQTERIYGQDDRGLRVRYLSEEATPWALDAGVAVVPASDDIPRVLFILQPANGTTLYRSPELPDQETILRAAAPIETESVEFLVDGLSVATAVGRDPRAIWALQPGQHHLEVVAHLPGGGRLQTGSRFEVR